MVLQSISDQSELCRRTFLKVREKEKKTRKSFTIKLQRINSPTIGNATGIPQILRKTYFSQILWKGKIYLI